MKTAPQYTDLKQYDLNDTIVSLPMIDIRASAHWAVYYVPATLKPLIELFHNVQTHHTHVTHVSNFSIAAFRFVVPRSGGEVYSPP